MISTCPRCQKQVSIPSGVDLAMLVRCPLCNAEYALSEALVPPELIPVVSHVDQIVIETTAATEQGSEPHNFAEENEAAAVVGQFPVMSASRRPRRKPKSALQTLIEIVTGGLAGCIVAYYALAFYYGPEFRNTGLPQLPLPGISWLTSPRTADGSPEKPAEKSDKKIRKSRLDEANDRSPRQDALVSRGKTAYSWNRKIC